MGYPKIAKSSPKKRACPSKTRTGPAKKRGKKPVAKCPKWPVNKIVNNIVFKRTIVKRSGAKKTNACGCRSAFRAIASANQPVPGAGGNPFPQVLYGMEEFDVNGEYNPATSTFIPRRSGIYSIFASVSFVLNTSTLVQVAMAVRVNNSPVLTDSETFTFGDDSIDAGGIVRLEAGDQVQVFFTIGGTVAGNIQSGVGTRFEAARVG
ncbi:complement C1q domain-containing protein [Paenibacillus arenilitoris]|uniref:C1q domain-containing protein n=1 Tax=Paenibacillus arenilitoris TaxID=2772299 RepID=A0A927H6Z1_9BACL|nr:hypothetical protein [Paenibacillus arenilitoris]MBD2870002.1 hypothetical protein [Paenibacillus arenilitoris]